jgi:hypothetical protein
MRLLATIGLVVGLALVTGCATVDKTGPEVVNTWNESLAMDAKQMSHDVNVFFLADRPSRLTEWYTR